MVVDYYHNLCVCGDWMKLKKKKKKKNFFFFLIFFFWKKKSRVGPEIFGSVGEPETQLFFFFGLKFQYFFSLLLSLS